MASTLSSLFNASENSWDCPRADGHLPADTNFPLPEFIRNDGLFFSCIRISDGPVPAAAVHSSGDESRKGPHPAVIACPLSPPRSIHPCTASEPAPRAEVHACAGHPLKALRIARSMSRWKRIVALNQSAVAATHQTHEFTKRRSHSRRRAASQTFCLKCGFQSRIGKSVSMPGTFTYDHGSAFVVCGVASSSRCGAVVGKSRSRCVNHAYALAVHGFRVVGLS